MICPTILCQGGAEVGQVGRDWAPHHHHPLKGVWWGGAVPARLFEVGHE